MAWVDGQGAKLNGRGTRVDHGRSHPESDAKRLNFSLLDLTFMGTKVLLLLARQCCNLQAVRRLIGCTCPVTLLYELSFPSATFLP